MTIDPKNYSVTSQENPQVYEDNTYGYEYVEASDYDYPGDELMDIEVSCNVAKGKYFE